MAPRPGAGTFVDGRDLAAGIVSMAMTRRETIASIRDPGNGTAAIAERKPNQTVSARGPCFYLNRRDLKEKSRGKLLQRYL